MKVFIHEVEYCGEEAIAKIKKLNDKLLDNNKKLIKFSFLTSRLDEIACKN